MTNRLHSLTVVLEADTRDDDAQALIAAISQLRGVLTFAACATTISGSGARRWKPPCAPR